MLESTIVKNIRKMIDGRGGWSRKIHGDQFTRDDIDLHVSYRGRFIGLEVKRPGEVPTRMQENTLAEIRRSGGIGECVTSVKEASNVLDAVDRSIRPD